MSFSVTATDGGARAGVLRTAHGDVPTPAFMPVGTKGTVKTVDPDELRAIGTAILLGNTYHLHFRPGDEVVAELGGLHAFMGWDGPILTDSGGFQVFSLRDTLLSVDDDGVTFRSVYDGRPERLMGTGDWGLGTGEARGPASYAGGRPLSRATSPQSPVPSPDKCGTTSLQPSNAPLRRISRQRVLRLPGDHVVELHDVVGAKRALDGDHRLRG